MKATVTALMVMAAGDLPQDGLASMRWQARPVLVFAEAGDARLDAQMALFEANAEDMADRRNVVVVDTSAESALRTQFRPEGFTVVLVGLDGGEKFRSGAVVAPDQLDALIDTMPMRRREITQ